MRWLVNYVRQVLCKHNFEKEEVQCTRLDEFGDVAREGTKVSLLCRKCAYHRSFWKF